MLGTPETTLREGYADTHFVQATSPLHFRYEGFVSLFWAMDFFGRKTFPDLFSRFVAANCSFDPAE